MKMNPFSLPDVLRGTPDSKFWWLFVFGFFLVGIVVAPLLMFPLVFIVGIGQGVPLFNSDLGAQGTAVYVTSSLIVAIVWLLVLMIIRNVSRLWFFIMLVGLVIFVLGYLSLSLSFVTTDYLGLAGAVVMLWSYWKMSGHTTKAKYVKNLDI